MSDVSANVFERTAEAAKRAKAVYPEALAEFLKDDLSVVDTIAGPQVFVRNGTQRESLEVAMNRLKQSEDIGPLFTEGKVNVKTMSYEQYLAVRKHSPELLGLRKKQRFA